ncbi:MAG: Retron-type RNA-directed DNA polymerase [Firmicutes bacterium]|nr:Retron-type RNA-directed DNA polymerase [Bacillota bacterium]
MKVTEDGIKHRKLRREGYLQKVPAEQGGYAEACAPSRITENNVANAYSSTDRLLEKILDKDNMNLAYKRVKSNKGAGGIDGMGVDELLPYLKENGQQLIQQIRDGKYRPNPVRRVEIPKEERGKVRKLGIPTVVDR